MGLGVGLLQLLPHPPQWRRSHCCCPLPAPLALPSAPSEEWSQEKGKVARQWVLQLRWAEGVGMGARERRCCYQQQRVQGAHEGVCCGVQGAVGVVGNSLAPAPCASAQALRMHGMQQGRRWQWQMLRQ